MKRKESRFVVMHEICILSLGDDFFKNYNLCIPPSTHQKRLALGLPLGVPLGCKKKMIE
jgi:hypothetical protein